MGTLRTLSFGLAVTALASTTAAVAQENRPPANTIVVDADLPEPEEVSHAARALTSGTSMISPIIRYHDPLCVQVFGLTDRLAEYVRNRVGRHAQEAGIELVENDCEANAIIMVGEEPRALYDALIDYNPRTIGARSSSRVRRDIADGEPVIVWHNLESRARDGITPLPNGEQTFVWPSRTRPPRVYSVVLGVVILDADHLVGMDMERLSDYATMRLLAPRLVPNRYEIDEPRSVIHPFVRDDGEAEMTRFDRAYLSALYAMPPQAPGSALPRAVALAFTAEE